MLWSNRLTRLKNKPFETMAYTSLQELATMVFYNNVAKVAGQHDKDLATLLRRLAKDETFTSNKKESYTLLL